MVNAYSSTVDVQRLHYQMARLRYQFLKSRLDLSFTLATFVRSREYGERLSESCRDTASKGYRTAAMGLSKMDLPESEKEILRSKLDLLRAVLQNPDTDA